MLIKENILNSCKKTPYYIKNNSCSNDLNDFKIITKHIVRQHYNEFISDDEKLNDVVEVFTSGSSGIPMKILWTPIDYCSSLAELWKIRRGFGVYPNDNFVTCHAAFYSDSLNIHNRVVIQKNMLSVSKVALNKSIFAYYYNLITSFNPKFMMLSPSFLYGLISYLEVENLRLPSSIKLVELTGESCSRELFNWFQEKYTNIYWKIMYGMQEFNGVAYGSPDGLSVLSKNVTVEIVDDLGEKSNMGEEGYIIVTGLKNTLFPLIRYKTEDKGFFDSNGMLHISRSRSNDVLCCQGRELDGSIFWAAILNLQHILNISIVQFQVRKKHNQLFFDLVISEMLGYSLREIEDNIACFLMDIYGVDYSVYVHVVDHIDIEEEKSKIKYFINEDECGEI